MKQIILAHATAYALDNTTAINARIEPPRVTTDHFSQPRLRILRIMKRLFDVIVSSLALGVFGPLLLILAARIVVCSGRPAFYKGWRAGKDGVPFEIRKLRTMVPSAEQQGGAETPRDDRKITPVGRSLRRSKLDEIPQFYNVLIGEMSIVGPRPEVVEEVKHYKNEEKQLLSVRPGITDWASIKFRHEDKILCGKTDPHQVYHKVIRPVKMRLGLKYVRERTMRIDLLIVMQTIFIVCKQ